MHPFVTVDMACAESGFFKLRCQCVPTPLPPLCTVPLFLVSYAYVIVWVLGQYFTLSPTFSLTTQAIRILSEDLLSRKGMG